MFSFKSRQYSSVDSEGEDTPWLKSESQASPSDDVASQANLRNASLREQILIYTIASIFLLGLGIALGICATLYGYKHLVDPEDHSNLKICM